ncbi:MAG TPA: hypothetical protein VGH81_07315 [Rudaea sp.]|jgi:hypothetical protein
MTGTAIPDDLRRFLLTGALTVPHVEAILQLRGGAAELWEAQHLAARLYVGVNVAARLLSDLCAMGVAKVVEPKSYLYSPATPELAALLDDLEKAYARNLVAVTHLIHTAEERKAHNFAAAFRFRKEP